MSHGVSAVDMSLTNLVLSPLCPSCSIASTILRDGKELSPDLLIFHCLGPAARLGTVAEYRRNANACSVCAVVLQEFVAQAAFNHQEPPDDDDTIEIVYTTYLRHWTLELAHPTMPGNAKSTSLYLDLVRFVDQNVSASSPLGPFENEMWAIPILDDAIDFDRMRGWKSHCDANHQGVCHGIQDVWKHIEPADELFLIDVHDLRIARRPGSILYLALSYVWGVEDTPLVATTSIIHELLKPGSLSLGSSIGSRLPKTIRDAMTVTSQMGYRYLWVDRICIVQDDYLHKQYQLSSMAAIYANAAVTLLACHGDESQGLPGLDPSVKRPRHSIFTLPGGARLLFNAPKQLGEPYQPMGVHDYRSRGWTLQEETLSRRTLSFNNHQVSWKCRKMRCFEIYDDSRQVKDNRTSSTEVVLLQPFPDIYTYGHLAVNYTKRFLTYEHDSVNALSAIIAAFSRPMEGGMLFGLPEVLFEGALLWQSSFPPLQRRGTRSIAPSWSFLGWTGGGLDVGIWSELYSIWGRIAAEQLMYFRSNTRLIPCVEFFKLGSGTDARTAVRSSYLAKHRKDPSAKDLQWCSHSVSLPSKPLVADLCNWQPLLVFKAQRCHIAAGDTIPNDKPKQCVEISLQGEDGELVGGMRLNEMQHAHLSGRRLELIALSKGVTSDPRTTVVPELRVIHAGCPKPCVFPPNCKAEKRFVPYEYYNVMWIGWNGCIAYRNAIGRVLGSYWDSLDPEEVEITLG
ncbi:hypothetical protein OQA88_7387 [Cercophora sp. LCS_1]